MRALIAGMSAGLLLAAVCAWGQPPVKTDLQGEAAKLRALVTATPRLALTKTVVKVQAPGAGWEMGFPSAVAAGRDGLLYVLQRGEKADPVLVVDGAGRVVRSWGRGMFAIAHSIRLDAAGNVWTVDAASSKVMKFTASGEKLLEIAVGGQPAGKGGFNGTTDVAFGAGGRVFVSDGYGNARVVEYTAEGKRVREWGRAGAGDGEFHLPHGIAVDERGLVYVADRENGRVQRFTMEGRHVGTWEMHGKVFSIAAGRDGIWVGVQHFNEPNGAPGWFLRLDRETGKALGVVDSYQGQHVLNLTAEGELLGGARPDVVLWFRRAGR